MGAEVVVSSGPSNGSPIVRIEVRVKVGDSLMAASDDPLYLGLRGPEGREFRLAFARGRSLRRGSEDRFVLGAPDAAETNVAMPELNDPGRPALQVEAVEGAYLRKGFDPIPNVRAVGELDDRLEVIEAELEIHVAGRTKPVRFQRSGPIWLGLVSGLYLELARAPDEG
jgi:hypothetical protein